GSAGSWTSGSTMSAASTSGWTSRRLIEEWPVSPIPATRSPSPPISRLILRGVRGRFWSPESFYEILRAEPPQPPRWLLLGEQARPGCKEARLLRDHHNKPHHLRLAPRGRGGEAGGGDRGRHRGRDSRLRPEVPPLQGHLPQG